MRIVWDRKLLLTPCGRRYATLLLERAIKFLERSGKTVTVTVEIDSRRRPR